MRYGVQRKADSLPETDFARFKRHRVATFIEGSDYAGNNGNTSLWSPIRCRDRVATGSHEGSHGNDLKLTARLEIAVVGEQDSTTGLQRGRVVQRVDHLHG